MPAFPAKAIFNRSHKARQRRSGDGLARAARERQEEVQFNLRQLSVCLRRSSGQACHRGAGIIIGCVVFVMQTLSFPR